MVEVEGGTLTSLAGFDGHQGVALVVEPRRWATIDEVLARARERGEPPFVLVLDSLEDPQNLGTMLRSAEACGVHGVLFPTRRAAPLTPAAVKASAGAVEHLLLVPLDDLAGGLVDLRLRGLRLVGADESASLAYRDADMRGPLALVVGSEGHGISGPIRRRIDLAVRIPMRGRVGSLNASVAGSVLLFEAAAQRPAPAVPEPGVDQAADAVSEAVIEAAPEVPAETPPAIEDAHALEVAEAVEDAAVEPEPAAAPVPESPPSHPGCGQPRHPRPMPRSRHRRPSPGPVARRPHRWQRRTRCPRMSARRTPTTTCCRPEGARVAHSSAGAVSFTVAADVAQLVEQRFCKPPVPGSSPVVGSN